MPETSPMSLIRTLLFCGIFCYILDAGRLAAVDDYEQVPINYSEAETNNPISKLQGKIDSGEVKLDYDPTWGYLPAVLKELNVSTKSQMLVFSKTSIQRHVISPSTPRAVYFNDDNYVGFCQSGDVVEVSTTDIGLGTVFYTMAQEKVEKPKFVRQGDNCLICHSSSNTQNVPGHLVRSVFVDRDGQPILASGSFRIDQTSALDRRWGGWYVSGTHGNVQHMGNLIVRSKEAPEKVDRTSGQNVTDLNGLGTFATTAYLSPHSDLVALMVHEHQTQAHNFLTRANYETRMAHHYESALNRDLGEDPEHRWESAKSRIRSSGEALVRYLFFSGEPKLAAPVAGTSGFREEFEARGPRDAQGRSLRDFDLRERLFKYPCSYLVYSDQFNELPDEMLQFVYHRMYDVLTGKDQSPEFAHLTDADRKAILEILVGTKTNLPDYWKLPAASEQASSK